MKVDILHKECVCVYTLFLSYFPFGETKNFCYTIVTRFVVGDLCKDIRWFYLKFIIGVFNRTLSIYLLCFIYLFLSSFLMSILKILPPLN